MFCKNEKRRRHPTLAIAVGALAVVGAVSIVNSGKRWVRDKKQCMMGMLRFGGHDKSEKNDFCE